MILKSRIVCGVISILVLVLGAAACNQPAPLSPDQAEFKKAVVTQVKTLQGLLGPALANGKGDAVDTALSRYFDETAWKNIACDFQVRVVDKKKQYIGGRMHLKNWDGSLPGPEVRLDYSTYAKSFDSIAKGEIFSRRFFNTDGPLVIIGGPVAHQGEPVGAFGIMLPGECMPGHYRLKQDQILAIDYNRD